MVEGEKKFGTAGHLKPGNFVLIDGEVCQVKGSEKSKPGKHGSAKVRVTAMGVFKSNKKTLLKSTDTDVEIPIIQRRAAQVVAIMGDIVQIMDLESYKTMDAAKPEITGLQSGVELEYLKWGDNVKIVRKK